MLKNIQEIVRQRIDKGLNTYKNIFELGAGHTPEAINVVYNNDGSRGKRLGASTINAIALESTAGYGMYDFGVLGQGGNDSNANLLLHGNGVDGSTTFTDSSRRGYTVTGVRAEIDTAQSKFGGASILFQPYSSMDISQTVSDNSSTLGDSANDEYRQSQSFTLSQATIITGASLRFSTTNGSPTGNVTYRIETNSGGLPSGTLAHANATVAFVPTASAWNDNNFASSFSLSSGTYWLVAQCDNQATDVYWTLLMNNSDVYSGGNQASSVNGTWTANTARDNAFKIFANLSDSYLTIPDNDDWYMGLANFTIDKQARFNSVLTSQMLIGQGSNASNQWYLQYGSAPNSLFFRSYSGGTLVVNVSGLWTPTTATWYHLELVRSATNSWYIFVNGSSLAAAGTTAGIVPQLASLLKIGVNVVTTNNTAFDGWMDEVRVSSNARHTADFTAPSVAYNSDFLQERRLLCASGTGVYYSSDIGKTFAIIQTNRTANTNYFGFIKDYVINTNESYDPPQYWAGTATQYFANISTATPACKHSASHQGFAILMNESANKTGFYYVDQNSMFNSAWSNFKLPTARNDELTAGFSLGRTLYVSSKYKIFRLDYIGGNPDWEYVDVKDWGFVPKTVRKVNIQGMGEAAIGLDWTKRIRIFFGSDDEVLSDSISKNNGMTPFYLDNISSVDLNKCWAEDDKKAGVYRLFVVYANSSTVSYSVNFNYRAGSLYAENNRPYQSGILATDTADNQLMLACNYNGKVVVMDSGNTEAGTAIDEYHTSSFIYNRSPSRVSKKQQVDLFLSATSSGTFYYEDRSDFSNVWNLRKTMTLSSAISSVQIRHTIDVPETVNVYQFKFSSSANTADPWNMNLVDLSFGDVGVGKG